MKSPKIFSVAAGYAIDTKCVITQVLKIRMTCLQPPGDGSGDGARGLETILTSSRRQDSRSRTQSWPNTLLTTMMGTLKFKKIPMR